MNLFIWDDYKWKLIKPIEYYKKSEYCIVRTLFVQWPKNANVEHAYNDAIRQHFEVYGSIESVVTVNGTPSGENTDTAQIHEAYVTFSRSEDAFNAFMANRSKAFKVLPADTWHQADAKEDSSEDDSKPTRRCNDSIESERGYKIFDVSQLSQLSLDEKNCDCNGMHTNLTIDFSQTKLKHLHKILTPLKDRIGKLHLKLSEIESDDANDNHLSCEEFMKRVAQVLEATLGHKFNELSLSAVQMNLTIEILNDFAPLLQQLNTLVLSVNSVDLYRLRDYCPNLDQLHVTALDSGVLGEPIQSWPSITALSIVGLMDIATDSESGIKFRQFIMLNSQIETLILHCIFDNDLMKTIATSLPHLKAFELIRKSYDDIDLVLDLLTGLKELESIKMNTLKVKKDELKAMEKSARKLEAKKQMRLVIMFQNYEPDTSEPEDYPRLVTFQLKDHDGCNCHKSKRVLEFEDDIDDELPKDGRVFVGIVNSKDPEKSADHLLMDKIEGAFNATRMYYPTKVAQFMVNDDNSNQFIYISHA